MTVGTPHTPTPSPRPLPSETVELSVFEATNPDGSWRLCVVDTFSGDVGGFADGWAAQIKAKARS